MNLGEDTIQPHNRSVKSPTSIYGSGGPWYIPTQDTSFSSQLL